MPPKQQKSNGFMIFTLEWKNKYGRGMSISEATTEAGKAWKEMDAQQRAPYNDKAKGENKIVGRNAPEKLACTGASLSLVEKERLDQENKEVRAKQNIDAIVRNSVLKHQLEDTPHFFIMVNYFTKTMKEGLYVPAEIAVCKFSLKGGVHPIYQTLINPGFNIYGHQYEAQHHSDTTHNLPLPPNALGDPELGRIYNDILNFIRHPDSGDYPPVYTHRDSVHVVESVLSFLKDDNTANNINLNVYSIQNLFFTLKMATCEAGQLEKPTNFYITDAYFDRDFFEFQSGIGCQFHEEIDKSKYCTQSYVTRWGFMFADYMCGDISIALIPGRHCPYNVNINAIVSPASTTYSDNESFISGATTATYLTKPIAGINDDQSMSDVSRSYNVDFPILGRSRVTKKKVADSYSTPPRHNETYTYKPRVDDDEMMECASWNPWMSRSQKIPKEPENSHFDIAFSKGEGNSDTDEFGSVLSYGRGRISLLDSSFSTIGASSCGRGRYMQP